MSSRESERTSSVRDKTERDLPRDLRSETQETIVSFDVDSDEETSSDLEQAKAAPSKQKQRPFRDKTVTLDVEASTSKESPKQDDLLMQEIDVISRPMRDRFYRGVSRLDGPNNAQRLLPHIITLILHILDITTPLATGIIYIVSNDPIQGSVTLIIFGITLIPTNCLSLYYFKQLNSRQQGRRSDHGVHETYSSCQELRILYHTDRAWFIAFVTFHALQLGLLFRILYMLHKIRQRQFGSLDEMNDLIHKVRLLESFLGSCLQAILQIVMILNPGMAGWAYAMSATTAVASTSSVVWVTRLHYGRYLKNRLKDRYPWFTETAILLSPLLTLTARFVAFALFTSHYQWRFFALLLIHLFVTVVEAIYSGIRLHAAVDIKSTILNCAAAIYIYLARERSLFGKFPWLYDIFILLENTGLFLAWYTIAGGSKTLYGLPLASVVWGGYIIGVTLKLSLIDSKRLSKYITL